MNKKENWIEVTCEVCQKTFKKPLQVMYKTGHPDFVVVKMEFCSPECKRIAEETENNKVPHCYHCNKYIDLNEYSGDNGFFADFEKRASYPSCDECNKVFAEELRKEIKNNLTS